MIWFNTRLGQSKEIPYFVIHLRVNVKQDSSMDSKRVALLLIKLPYISTILLFLKNEIVEIIHLNKTSQYSFSSLQFQLCYDIKHFLNVFISFGGDDSSKLHSFESKSSSIKNWIWKLNEFAFCFFYFFCITSFTIFLQLYYS
jgi:hypothetical protein